MFETVNNTIYQPSNYHRISDVMSRSAQPSVENFKWLKEQGVTDVLNFRTYLNLPQTFSEKEIVESLNMRYHAIPSVTAQPTMQNVEHFLDITEGIEKIGGKGHIHCMSGVDRTGMYSFLYKMMKGLGTLEQNIAEWKAFGFREWKYPHLENWAKSCFERLVKMKKI